MVNIARGQITVNSLD
jgi:hypothetical protein